MQTILVAARSESFCCALAEIAKKRFETVMCHDGLQTLKQFGSGKPDVLVLDMELPGMDGISVLRAMRSNGYSVPVVALTACVQSTYLSQMTAELNVEYVIAKPCTASAVLERVTDIFVHRDNNEQPRDPDLLVDTMLLGLNFTANRKGYSCLVEAIKQYEADPTQQITKSLYPSVAKVCGGSSGGVEHAMRTSIYDAWSHRNESLWYMYFPRGKKGGKPPTNGRFIAKMAKCLKNMRTG